MPGWAANTSTIGGSIFTGSGSLDPLWGVQRTATETLEYQFNVPNATYSVRLGFAEIGDAQVNYRRFNLVVNGANYGELDIALLVPGQNRYFIPGLPSPITVTNGQIEIQLVRITGN